jgi:hypothetical protein
MNIGKEGNPTKKQRRIIIRDDKDRSEEEEADGVTAKQVPCVQSYHTNIPIEAKQQSKAQTTCIKTWLRSHMHDDTFAACGLLAWYGQNNKKEFYKMLDLVKIANDFANSNSG